MPQYEPDTNYGGERLYAFDLIKSSVFRGKLHGVLECCCGKNSVFGK